jgi:putative transposase
LASSGKSFTWGMNSPHRADPTRQSLPHLAPLEFPNQSIIQYVTVCTDRRRPILAHDDIHAVVVQSLMRANHWVVGRYVIMPDHLHLLCAPVNPNTPLKRWLGFWRADATRNWPRPDEKPIWQRDFFDRQLRSMESYRDKWLYIWENPIRAGLVQTPDQWPYKGELNVLSWHEPQ